MWRFRGWLVVVLSLGLLVSPVPTQGQGVPPPIVRADVCAEPNGTIGGACPLGQPNAMGNTVQGLFQDLADVDVYRFEVPAGGAQAHLTLSDLWHEGSLQLYEAGPGTLIAESDRRGQTQGQLLAPEVINHWLEGGSYAAYVTPGQEGWVGAEAHSYTLRVALGPRPAAPAGPGPAPAEARGYQLTLSIEPEAPGPFSLMTFTATVDPPFSDLFDFSWTIDGQPFEENAQVIQLPRPSRGAHTVLVVARGARYYPDLTLPELPPTLSASGSFQVP
jgi:hypothetical protein